MIHNRCCQWQIYFLLTFWCLPDGFKIFCFEENDIRRDDLSSNQHYSLYIVSTVSATRQFFWQFLLDFSFVDSINCYINFFIRATTFATYTYQDVNTKIISNVWIVINAFYGKFWVKTYWENRYNNNLKMLCLYLLGQNCLHFTF